MARSPSAVGGFLLEPGALESKEMNSFVALIYFIVRNVETNLYCHQQFISVRFPFCLSRVAFSILIDLG